MALPGVEALTLKLVPEPDNPHDPDAIRVEFEYDKGKFFHLGYVPNAETICMECSEQFERHPQGNSCPNCGRKGRMERHGTATRIKDEFKRGFVYAEVKEVTGGKEGQSLGCNIEVLITDTDD